MYAVSQSLSMYIEPTFEGVDGRCFNNMAWQCIPGIQYLVTVE